MLSPARRAEIFDRLMWGTHFESFIAQKWTAAKRFGLEGCETLIPGMKVYMHGAMHRVVLVTLVQNYGPN